MYIINHINSFLSKYVMLILIFNLLIIWDVWVRAEKRPTSNFKTLE